MKTKNYKDIQLADIPHYYQPEIGNCYRHEDIQRALGKRLYSKFCKFMDGQTVCEFGVYEFDLRHFILLKSLPIKRITIYD